MSYILDALKKAESERKLGSVPDMHTQQLAAASATESRVRRRLQALGTLAAAGLIAGGIVWYANWQSNQRIDPGSSASQVSAGTVSNDTKQDAVIAPPLTATETPPAQVAQAATAEEAPVTPKITQETARPAPAKSNPVPVPAKKKKPEVVPANTASERPQSIERKKPRAEPAAVAVAEPRLIGFRDLPENIQREIPALTIGGYIYSSVASERSILINNRLLREGSEIGHGLVLEKMLPKEAILNYKGYRYRIPY